MALEEHFDLRLSEELMEELAELARRKGKSASAVCRDLMEAGMNEEPGRLREQLVRSLARARTLLLHGQDAELVDDVDELVDVLADIESELEEEGGSEHESDDDEEPEPE